MATYTRQMGIAAAISMALAASAVQAGPEDALNFVAGTAVTYDSNLFRLDDNRPLPGGVQDSRSDVIYTTHAGLRFDKAYSLQRFQVDATATMNRFQKHDFLNFTALDYRAAWLWSVTPDVTGTLSADRTEALTSYADFAASGSRNVQTREIQRLLADWRVTGGWHAIGGLIRQKVDNTTAFNAVGSYTQETAEGGVRYVTAGNNSLAIVGRGSRGEYEFRSGTALPTEFDQTEAELQGRWQITGHSSLDGRLGYLDRKHDTFGQRDFSGTVGALNYRWTPTGKLQFTLSAGRDLYSYQQNAGISTDYGSSYYIADYATLTPVWSISEKTSARLRLGIAQRDYRGAVIGISGREDTLRSAQIGLTWRPTRSIDIDAHYTAEQRSTNAPGLDYHANMAGVSAALRF